MTEQSFIPQAAAQHQEPAEESYPHVQFSDGKSEYRFVAYFDQPQNGLKITVRGDDLHQVIEDVYQMRVLAMAMASVAPLIPQPQPQLQQPGQQQPTAGNWGNPQQPQFAPAPGMGQPQMPFQPTPQNLPQPGFQPQQQPQQPQQGYSGGGQRRSYGGGGGQRQNTMTMSMLANGIPNCQHGLPYNQFTSPKGNVGFECGGAIQGVPKPQQCPTLWSEQNQR